MAKYEYDVKVTNRRVVHESHTVTSDRPLTYEEIEDVIAHGKTLESVYTEMYETDEDTAYDNIEIGDIDPEPPYGEPE